MTGDAATEDQFNKHQVSGIYSFQIRLFTQNDERVAVGPGGDLIRWGKDNATHEQEWILVPVAGRCGLLSNKNALDNHYIKLASWPDMTLFDAGEDHWRLPRHRRQDAGGAWGGVPPHMLA